MCTVAIMEVSVIFSPLSLYTQTNRCSRKEYAVSVTCDMSAIAHRLQSKLKNGSDQQCRKAEGKEEEGSGRMRFRARIRPDESECAEEELRKEIRCICYGYGLFTDGNAAYLSVCGERLMLLIK